MEDGDVFYFVEKGKFGTCKKGVLEYDENSVNVNEGSTSDFYSADVTCQSNEKLVVKLVVKKKVLQLVVVINSLQISMFD